MCTDNLKTASMSHPTTSSGREATGRCVQEERMIHAMGHGKPTRIRCGRVQDGGQGHGVQDRERYAAIITDIQQKISARLYRLTAHAEREREADRITIRELEEALRLQRCQVIEDYPEDPRGASCLVLGFTEQDLPIHTVCGISLPERLIIVTVYRPDPALWLDWRVR